MMRWPTRCADRRQVLVVRSTQVTDAMLDAGALSLIVRAGAGVNTIDVAGASRRGIYVSNCPGKNAVAVAELAMGCSSRSIAGSPTTSPICGPATGTRRNTPRRRACSAARSGCSGSATSVRKWRGAPGPSGCP